jgi:peptide/nickel transport system permease protein
MVRLLRMLTLRLLLGIGTLFAVCVFMFTAVELLPYDVAAAVLGQGATPETLAAYRLELGLNRPAYVRFLEWLGNAMQGDLGTALTNQRNILTSIAPRLTNTMFLAGYAALIAVPLAVVLGIVAAINEGKWPDKVANVVSLITISAPEFLVGYLLIYYFAINWELFESQSTVFEDMGMADRVYKVFLPAVALTLLTTAHILRTTRSAILSVMSQPYIEMAFLKGLSRARVILVHALPNAAAPIISVVALNLAYLVAGVVVIEIVFVYPGVGQFMLDGVTKGDVPVILAGALVFATAFIGLNTLADILIILVNPRLRHPK